MRFDATGGKMAGFKDPDGNIFSLVTPPYRAEEAAVAAAVRSTT